MSTIQDNEFGTITLRKSVKARSIRARVAPDGTLRISAPVYVPLLVIRQFVRTSRPAIRELLDTHRSTAITFEDGMSIGKSHALIVRRGSSTMSVRRHGQQIIASLPVDDSLDDEMVIQEIRRVVISALRLEAKSYLPKRLAYIAEKTGFSYSSVRFSHAGSRWGSCSSGGTISLNIALMKLPFELIDYVLVHELAHTVEMNHSERFWKLVEQYDPNFKEHRRKLKTETPSV